jgi:putative phosphoribosyl transferase
MQYRNRAEAGRWLALELTKYAGLSDVVVLALQGGGVPIANEVSRSLKAPTDILVVRKLGMPGRSEVVIGAVTSGGITVLNEALIQRLQLTKAEIDQIIANEKVELELKEHRFRGDRPFLKLEGKTVILVDDGLRTGSSMRTAIEAVKKQQPKQIVMAIPVAPATVYDDFKGLADEIICLTAPKDFEAVHDYYLELHSVTDEEIHKLLEWAAERFATV